MCAVYAGTSVCLPMNLCQKVHISCTLVVSDIVLQVSIKRFLKRNLADVGMNQ